MTATWRQASSRLLAKALAATVVITGLSMAGFFAPPAGAAPGQASAGTRSAAADGQLTNATSTSSANGGVTMWCTRSNGSVNPGLLDLLSTQYQSGPVETVTCVPAAVGSDGTITVLSECAVNITYPNPGALDLLGAGFRSNPVRTMTCAPAAVSGGDSSGVTVLSACAVTNASMHPGVLGLLALQFQSGPVQSVTCIPVTVVAGSMGGSPPGGAAHASGSLGKAMNDEVAASVQGRSAFIPSGALAATGPPQSPLAIPGMSGLLIGLGLLGLHIARAVSRGPSTAVVSAPLLNTGAVRVERAPRV